MMKSKVWQIYGLGMLEKVLLEYLVTSPHTTSIGYYYLPIEYIMCDMSLSREDVETGIASLIDKSYIAYDKDVSFVAVSNFNRYVSYDANAKCDIVNALTTMVQSGVFKVTYDWLKRADAYMNERLDNLPWVSEALAMPIPSFNQTLSVVKKTRKPRKSKLAKDTDNVSSKEDIVMFAKELSSGKRENEPNVEKNDISEAEEQPPVEGKQDESEQTGSLETVSETASAKEEHAETESVGEKEALATNAIEEKVEKVEKKADKKDNPAVAQQKEEFDSIWKKYPNKTGKAAALEGYLLMLKKGELTFAVANRAVDNYNYYIKKNNVEAQYVMGGRSFFGKNSKRIFEFLDASEEAEGSEEDSLKKLKEELKPKFNTFWVIYPKKVGKELAEKNFTEIVKTGDYTAEQLIEAATAYVSECRAKNTEDRYIKRADNFLDLNARPFRDYIDRDDLNSFVNVHSGEVEEQVDNGIEAMERMLAKNSGEETADTGVDEKASEDISAKEETNTDESEEKSVEFKDFAEAMTESEDIEQSFEDNAPMENTETVTSIESKIEDEDVPTIPAYNSDEDDEDFSEEGDSSDESFTNYANYADDEDESGEEASDAGIWDPTWGMEEEKFVDEWTN